MPLDAEKEYASGLRNVHFDWDSKESRLTVKTFHVSRSIPCSQPVSRDMARALESHVVSDTWRSLPLRYMPDASRPSFGNAAAYSRLTPLAYNSQRTISGKESNLSWLQSAAGLLLSWWTVPYPFFHVCNCRHHHAPPPANIFCLKHLKLCIRL